MSERAIYRDDRGNVAYGPKYYEDDNTPIDSENGTCCTGVACGGSYSTITYKGSMLKKLDYNGDETYWGEGYFLLGGSTTNSVYVVGDGGERKESLPKIDYKFEWSGHDETWEYEDSRGNKVGFIEELSGANIYGDFDRVFMDSDYDSIKTGKIKDRSFLYSKYEKIEKPESELNINKDIPFLGFIYYLQNKYNVLIKYGKATEEEKDNYDVIISLIEHGNYFAINISSAFPPAEMLEIVFKDMVSGYRYSNDLDVEDVEVICGDNRCCGRLKAFDISDFWALRSQKPYGEISLNKIKIKNTMNIVLEFEK